MQRSLEVVAAIPHIGSDELSIPSLQHVLEQQYAGVYLLDRDPTDHTMSVVESFAGAVELVQGEKKCTDTALRNRMLGVLADRDNVIIHYLDAGLDLETPDTPQRAREVMQESAFAFVGGLVKNRDGSQMCYNFGPRQCAYNDYYALVQYRVEVLRQNNPRRAAELRAKHALGLRDWPNPFEQPEARPVFWSTEQNLLVSSEVLRRVHGFDPKLRYHGIIELAMRLEKQGLNGRFDPTISAQQSSLQVPGWTEGIARQRETVRIARKHGFLNYLMPGGKFKPETVATQ